MDGENKYGTITPFMKATGSMIKPTEEEGSFMQMAMCTKGPGKMIKPMGRACISMKMDQNITANGSTITSMA